MIYQLPNGKVIHITIEQYLDLTDEDIQAMIGGNHGEDVISPWYGSAISRKKRTKTIEVDNHDEGIDYTEETDEILVVERLNLSDIPSIEVPPNSPEDLDQDDI